MIIVEFVSARNPKETLYFLGESLADILFDTANGTSFGGTPLKSYREVDLKTIQGVDDKSLRNGLEVLSEGTDKSYYVGSRRT